MRCPDCNKFVGQEATAELDHVEVDDDGLVRSVVRVVLACADCGTELAEASPEGEAVPDGIDAHPCVSKEGRKGFELIDDGDPEAEDRYETKDRHGKPITKMRYQRHYYGYSLTSRIKCLDCNEEFDVTTTGEERASGFDSLV